MRIKSLLPMLGIFTLALFAFQIVTPLSKAIPVSVTFDIKPDTLNIIKKGLWLTGFITLTSDDYNVSDINTSKPILLDGLFKAVWSNIEDNTLVVKFDYSPELKDHLWGKLYHMDMGKRTSVELEVMGELNDGKVFNGMDTITIIDPPFGK